MVHNASVLGQFTKMKKNTTTEGIGHKNRPGFLKYKIGGDPGQAS